MLSAVYHPSSDAAWVMTVSDETASIVGLWKFRDALQRSTATNTNPMPDGVLIDFAPSHGIPDGTITWRCRRDLQALHVLSILVWGDERHHTGCQHQERRSMDALATPDLNSCIPGDANAGQS